MKFNILIFIILFSKKIMPATINEQAKTNLNQVLTNSIPAVLHKIIFSYYDNEIENVYNNLFDLAEKNRTNLKALTNIFNEVRNLRKKAIQDFTNESWLVKRFINLEIEIFFIIEEIKILDKNFYTNHNVPPARFLNNYYNQEFDKNINPLIKFLRSNYSDNDETEINNCLNYSNDANKDLNYLIKLIYKLFISLKIRESNNIDKVLELLKEIIFNRFEIFFQNKEEQFKKFSINSDIINQYKKSICDQQAINLSNKIYDKFININ